jgi:hypothetical protein
MLCFEWKTSDNIQNSDRSVIELLNYNWSSTCKVYNPTSSFTNTELHTFIQTPYLHIITLDLQKRTVICIGDNITMHLDTVLKQKGVRIMPPQISLVVQILKTTYPKLDVGEW